MKIKINYPAWSVVAILLGVLLGFNIVADFAFSMIVRSGAISDGAGVFLSYTSAFLIAVFVAYLLIKKMIEGGETVFKFNIKGTNFSVVLLGFVLITAVGVIIEPLIMTFPDKYVEMLSRAVSYGGWSLLTLVLCAPILEEMLFRGAIQEILTKKYKPFLGIIISAAIFGVVHYIPQQVVNAFFVGIVLGYIYYLTKSLTNVILIHALNNLLAYFITTITGDPLLSTKDAIGNDNIYYVIYGFAIAVVVASIIAIVLVIKRKEAQGKVAMLSADKDSEDIFAQGDTSDAK